MDEPPRDYTEAVSHVVAGLACALDRATAAGLVLDDAGIAAREQASILIARLPGRFIGARGRCPTCKEQVRILDWRDDNDVLEVVGSCAHTFPAMPFLADPSFVGR